ncbi:hypothetical protein [Paenibacillus sp. MMO-58]|uniref:hypothetical protein n=1 Tax=Paenibacillus sp. MMO-58 TaxID=3081290 RepID=UPI0030176CD6
MFREEIIRVFTGRSFYLAVLLGILASFIGIINYGYPGQFDDLVAIKAWMFAVASGGTAIFSIFAPLLSTLPFADSYVTDLKTGYLRSILMRTNKKQYIWTKLAVNALGGGLAVSLPMFISLIFSFLFYKNDLPLDASLLGAFSTLGKYSPLLYALLLSAVGFLFGMGWATFGLALSIMIHNRFLVLGLPLLIYIATNFVAAIMAAVLNIRILIAFTPPSTLAPFTVTVSKWWTVFSEIGVLLLISTIFFAWQSRKGEVV